MQPWEGRSLWVWYLVDIPDIIKKAHAINADTLIIKAHNGSDYWTQFNASDVKKLQSEGFHVGAWGYCLPINIHEQANCIIRAFENGAEFYVCDAEIEFEDPSHAATVYSLMSDVKKVSKKPIGFTSFAFPSYHPGFLWSQFAVECDFTMPQIYWGDFKRDVYSACSQSVAEYKKLGKPVVPIGQLYGGVSNSEIAMFLQLSGQSSSWWDYAHLSPNQYSVFQRGGSTMQLGSTGPEVAQLQKDLSLVLKASIKADGSYGLATTAAVKTFQQLYGVRPVDGIAGPVTMAVLKHEVSIHTIPTVLPKVVAPIQPKVEPKPVETTPILKSVAGMVVVSTPEQKSNVAQARDLLTQALKLLEGVE